MGALGNSIVLELMALIYLLVTYIVADIISDPENVSRAYCYLLFLA